MNNKNNKIDISIVIPLFNEEESLRELFLWIKKVMDVNKYDYQVIFVNDGSSDNSWEVITALATEFPQVKGISFRVNYGKSAALNKGFALSEGEVIVTLDADLQDSPDEIPQMYLMIKEQGYDLVSGWKKKRYDPISKTIPTKLFNWTTRKVSGINNLHDFNCGLKAYRSHLVKSINIYGEMHRYIPYLAKQAGFQKITEKEVQHQERKYGVSKFGIERFINGFLDLLSITFLHKFGKRPLHFFGSIGIIMFLIGFVLVFWLGIYKIFLNTASRLIADKAEFYIALGFMISGIQLFLAGFIGELITRNSTKTNDYQIDKEI